MVPLMSRNLSTRHTGYINPMLAYGEEKAIQDAKDVGANGFIMVDLPPEEAIVFRKKCTSVGSVFDRLKRALLMDVPQAFIRPSDRTLNDTAAH